MMDIDKGVVIAFAPISIYGCPLYEIKSICTKKNKEIDMLHEKYK